MFYLTQKLILISFITLALTACGASEESKNQSKKDKSEVKKTKSTKISFIQNVVTRNGFPTKLIEHKSCIESKPKHTDIILKAFNKREAEIKEYLNKYEESDDAGKKYLDTKAERITSVKLVDSCPQNANASCEYSSNIQFFYFENDSNPVLKMQEKICSVIQQNIWTNNP